MMCVIILGEMTVAGRAVIKTGTGFQRSFFTIFVRTSFKRTVSRSWVLHTALATLLVAVNFNLSDAPSAQDNLSKLLTAPTPLPKMCTNLKGVGAEAALGGERW